MPIAFAPASLLMPARRLGSTIIHRFGLRQEPVHVLVGHGLTFLDERAEIVALLEILVVLDAVADDALVLEKEPNQAGRQHEVDERVEEREALEGLVHGDPEHGGVEPF